MSTNLLSGRSAKTDTVSLISLLFPKRSHDHTLQYGFLLVLTKSLLLAFVLISAVNYILMNYSLRGHFANPYLYILSDALSDNEHADIECLNCKPTVHLQCQRYINTRKYQVGCMSPPSSLYPILITGLGGCGSHHIAQRLGRMGLQLPHEELGGDGSVSWFYAVNDVLAHGQYPHRARLKAGAGRSYESPRFQNVLHVVRCPMQHISSFTAHLNSSYDFIRSHLLAQIDSANCSQPLSTSSTQLRSSESALEANVSCDDYEDSIWHSRNYKSFFSRRRGIILESGKNCPRGERCWLYFAALSWLFWTSHIQRYSSSFYRIETDLNRLTSETKFLVDLSKSKSSISVEDYLQPLSVLRKFYRKNKPRVPSVKHRIHGSYNLSDIFEIDPELAREVEIVAKYFGYKLSNKDLDYDDVVGRLGTGRAKVQSSLTASEHASTFENYLMTQDDSDGKLFNCFDMNNI